MGILRPGCGWYHPWRWRVWLDGVHGARVCVTGIISDRDFYPLLVLNLGFRRILH